MNERQFGARLTSDGASFSLWAPAAKRVELLLDTSHPMQRGEGGWFAADVAGVKAGARYKFRIDDEIDVPDPASAFQPDDIKGPSELIDHGAYRWRAADWRGRPWQDTVLLESHVGTFTPDGTYRAMIGRLDHLMETGITALELMPLAGFAGSRNWGYDGVLWYAPDGTYGRPDDLKALIDEAHLRGLMVFLDVVYNHFGPEGNYLGRYAPDFFTEAQTPWGSAIDYRVRQVRAFAIGNALYWLREYRFDGLRLDAVHAIPELGEISMLHDLSRAVGDLAIETGRHIHLVLENDDNAASLLDAGQDPPRGNYRAQWNDDYHHAWHVLLTGEVHGYYGDYARSPLRDIARALASGFVYQGEASAHRGGALRGEPSGQLAPISFVNFLQNHDQIGNRALGDRLEAIAEPRAVEAGLAITLLAPMVPMLFMGEEWGSKAPFPFFCDFEGELAEAVRQGRRREFADAYAEHGNEVPDPLERSTAESAVLDWDSRDQANGRRRLALVRDLLAIRREKIVPRLASAAFGEAHAADNGLLTANWRMGDGAMLRLMANLSNDEIPRPEIELMGTPIWGGAASGPIPPWSVFWRLDFAMMTADVPIATYRLQLTADFNFDAAAAVVPYLKALGISHLYASPFMKARKGSTHGYDIVDHTKLNPELGGEAGFLRLSEALQRHDIGLILDFVPNHVGVHFADNPWWLDVLEWGPASPHAVSFDIDWDQLPYRARGGVLLPVIGSSYGRALESGEIELRYDAAEGSFSAWYFEHRLPIAPERYSEILRSVVREAGADDSAAGKRILALAARYKGLRHPNRKEAPAFKAELQAIDGGADIIAHGLDAYRAGADRPAQILALHHLLERQHYKLGHWRLASSDINYRRFFDVNTLAGLRVEDPGTLDSIHCLVKQLIADGRLQGLRLDHIDGLRDPAQYFQRLRRLIRDAQGEHAKPFYLVIEKILGEGEKLHPFSGVHGTTGYEWMNVITHVLVDGNGLDPLDEIWRQVSNTSPKLEPLLKEAKRRVLETLLASEFTVLARLLARIAGGHYSTRDYSADSLRQALELYVLHFPVYRTYLTSSAPSPHDRALISATIEKARADWFAADEGIFDFLRDALAMDLLKPGGPAHSAPRVRRFALKVQQFTGPLMAKSLEDTAFYRYHRLLALNEVGGDPSARALSVDAFHDMMQTRASEWPHGMTSTATHDTKRGEDARARILALAEIPGEWTSTVGRWKVLNAPHLVIEGEMRAPSAAFEYMLYQALLGAWPMDGPDETFAERVQAYALKAAREGKQETSWLNPNQAYEAGLHTFIERILDPTVSAEFLDSMETLARRVALLGALNSLSQITLKATMPGVPDFYQGTEFWDLSLVDPDNRRPVDFAARAAVLPALEIPDWPDLAQHWPDGHIKLAWTRRLLKRRAELADLFAHGDYQPLEVSGPHRDHVIAFARRRGRDAVIVAVTKSFAAFSQGGRSWPRGDVFDGTVNLKGHSLEGLGKNGAIEVPLSLLFQHLPVAVMKAKFQGALKPARKRGRR